MVVLVLGTAPAFGAARSFSDGLQYRPYAGVEPCVAAASCREAPALWEGVAADQQGAPALESSASMGLNAETSPVPEPQNWTLFLAGLALVVLIALRRRAGRPVLPSLKFPV